MRGGARRAAGYGITDQRSVALFVDTRTGLDPAFDERPEFREQLEYRALPADRRMERVIDLACASGDAAAEQLGAAARSACATFETSPIDDLVAACEPTNLEIRLLDADGRGVPREPVWIGRLPSLNVYEVIETRLDDDGYLELRDLVPGDYLVRFPRREHQEPDILTWISFRLEDDRGSPLPFEPFRVFLANGERIDATRDGRGGLQANGTPLLPGRSCAVPMPGGHDAWVTLDARGEEVRFDHVLPGDVVIFYPEREGLDHGVDPYLAPEPETDSRTNP